MMLLEERMNGLQGRGDVTQGSEVMDVEFKPTDGAVFESRCR